MLDPVSNKVSFPEMEKNILTFWEEKHIFEKSLKQREGSQEYLFYDGPPFATGLPHYGHLLAGTIKDIVPRYQAMRGRYVRRRFGWDCHGLPVEYEMEQELNISGKRDIEKMGVGVFNEKCRSIVLRYTEEWRQIVTRMGRWVDFDHDYKTMSTDYMESIWWVFKTLWDKGLIYEGLKILPYCPRCATPLSNFETNQGYKEVQDPAVTIRFCLNDQPETYILAWTTTPWTLPSNLALAVGADIDYVKVRDGNACYILAKERLSVYYKKADDYEVIEEMKGAHLAGLTYQPLFPYFRALSQQGAFTVGCATFVSTGDGTGVVHIAPGFGEDDSVLGRQMGLPMLCPVDDEGRFTPEIADYAGRPVKECDADIIKRLKEEGSLIHRSTIVHTYPHCWRCDSPLIYRGISTWFVRVEEFRDRIIKANKSIQWLPAHLKEGRFGKWLEGARDWAISRNRYWGTPLPIWKSEDGSEVVCLGSVKELEQRTGTKVSDLHKHYVDDLVIPSSSGKGVLRRIPEVLDCWFESGAMPYAQSHYPFENKAQFETHFPADFIAEGLDQTRGWFYTLMVLSTALFDKPAFRHVVVNGLILAEDGRKMSKRLKNYPDPKYMLDAYGADALRLYMINSPVVRAEDLCFSEEGVKHALRHLLIPWWNAYSFFVTYARIDGWKPQPAAMSSAGKNNLLDRWIVSSAERLTQEVMTAMDDYDLQKSVRPFVRFVEDLTNWYIRRSRRRFWKSSDDHDKAEAYETLYAVLLRLSKVAAPFVPFISEAIYQNLRTPEMPESIHLCDYPQSNESLRDRVLEQRMDTIMTAVSLGRQIRSEHNLKVRQPLNGIHIVSRDAQTLSDMEELKHILADELNVKNVWFSDRETELVTLIAKPNFKVLGPRLGSSVKKAGAAIQVLSQEQLTQALDGNGATIEIDGKPFVLTGADLSVDRLPKDSLAVASEGGLVVALETELTEPLIMEGYAREVVNKIQNMRKEADYDVVQRIRVEIHTGTSLWHALSNHIEYIKNETLAIDVQRIEQTPSQGTEWDVNGLSCILKIERV